MGEFGACNRNQLAGDIVCGAIVEGILQPTAVQDPGFLGQITESTTVGPKQKCRHLHHFVSILTEHGLEVWLVKIVVAKFGAKPCFRYYYDVNIILLTFGKV